MTDTPTKTTLLRAARAIDAYTDTTDAWIFAAGGIIRAVGSGPDAPAADQFADLGDATLVPGFIDLHGHGGASGAYDNAADEILAALAMHRRHGTTRSVLSLVANPIPALTRSLATIREVMAEDPLVLGVHLEGPFLSAHNQGAHERGFLLDPARQTIDKLLEAADGALRQVTIAPELTGATDAIRHLVDHDVLTAVGHTVATYDQARAAFDAGATLLTHTFNAMPGIHHRNPGPVAAAVADDRVSLELILDGVHVAPVVALTLFRAVPDRVALITDAMAAAGSPDGTYRLGSLSVSVNHGIARVAGTDTIAGSTLTQDIALLNAVKLGGMTLRQAVAALTAVPAEALGLARRLGALAPGYAADVVALSPDLAIKAVWAAGVSITPR
ncbi:N-acetylglucosamine-6-phosphate deacetylase [Amycolatopsis sp. GM8]|uniref:N-acetylglucosamine-6-phosphate deacetylase n=1 Tax=Amycolatopsis sp. GM8 TaxID=2896530 RepID=UPI001F027EB0|nr:N-acetylglucosamine-6-phosphate deacetylase [Amycolatopsis sp. GM8]